MSAIDTPSYRFFSASSKTSFIETSSSPSHASLMSAATLSISKGSNVPSVLVIFISSRFGISITGASFFLS